MLKKIFNKRNFIIFTFVTLLLSAVFTALRIAFAPLTPPPGMAESRTKSHYVLMLLQCIVGVIAMLLPSIFKKRLDISIPSNMMFVYTLFLFCAIYLGEVRSFYYRVPHWDTMLHAFSGAMLAALGFSVLCLLNNTDRVPIFLSPAFVAVFTFSFAVSLGVVWEVYEYLADIILGTNMQKFALESGQLLAGQAALADTMKDLIVDCLGALLVSIAGFVSLKHEKGWVEKLQLKTNHAKRTAPPAGPPRAEEKNK